MTGHNEFPTEVINAQSITLGDGANDASTVLLRFNIDRAWQFRQNSTGASTALALLEEDNNKSLVISTVTGGGGTVTIQPGLSTNSNAVMTITDAKDNAGAYALDIDRDGNSASKVVGARIVVDNAGAGNVIGIDMSSFSAGEALLKVPASAVSSAGTLSHQIPIDIGGTVFYLYAYTTGT